LTMIIAGRKIQALQVLDPYTDERGETTS